MTKDESKLDAGPVADDADYWLRVLADQPTDERLAAFRQWIDASPRHLKAFCRAKKVDNCLQDIFEASPIDVDGLFKEAQRERQLKLRCACGAGIVSIAVAALLITNAIHAQGKQTYATTEKQESIELEDGSVVALNTQSAIEVVFSADSRDLYLEQGEGIFRVRHELGRPFRVHAGKAIVEAMGTQFDVRVARDQAAIAVVEGVVQLKRRPSFMSALVGTTRADKLPELSAGQSVTVDREGRAEEVKPIDVVAATVWRQPEERLEFTDESLAAIAEEFNRHNAAPKLRIEGDALRERLYRYLSFNNANPESFISGLTKDETLELVREGDDIVVRERNR